MIHVSSHSVTDLSVTKIKDVTTATMLAAKGGQKSFADPQTYDPMRWLPPPMVNSSKRHPLTTDIPKNQCERDKL